MKNIVIFGNSGHAKAICEVIRREGKYNISYVIVKETNNLSTAQNLIPESLFDQAFINNNIS